MALISYTPLQDGVTGVNAAATNTPLSTIYNDYNGNITDANIAAAAAIAQSKLSLTLATADSALVATNETTTSATYTDLATPGPAVTVTIGASGKALVSIFSGMANDTGSRFAWMSFAVSGANTQAAADAFAIQFETYTATAPAQYGATFLLKGLAAGSTTFTAKYNRGAANTANFNNRRISVVPL